MAGMNGNYSEECAAYKEEWINEGAIRSGFTCQQNHNLPGQPIAVRHVGTVNPIQPLHDNVWLTGFCKGKCTRIGRPPVRMSRCPFVQAIVCFWRWKIELWPFTYLTTQ